MEDRQKPALQPFDRTRITEQNCAAWLQLLKTKLLACGYSTNHHHQ
jgi:hypothetical protein